MADRLSGIANNLGITHTYALMKRRLTQSQVAIITYHRVGDPAEFPWCLPLVAVQDFESQISYLRSSFKIMAMDDLVNCLENGNYLPEKAAVITFDDGYKNNFTHAFPILKKYGVMAHINLATSHVDAGSLFWCEKIKYALWETGLQKIELDELGQYRLGSSLERANAAARINLYLATFPENKKNLTIDKIIRMAGVKIPVELGRKVALSWDDVREMSKNGITFGAHTLTHANLAKLPLKEARHEIAQSKRDIEDKLQQEVAGFCYPNGDFNDEVINIVKDEGFRYGLTAIPGMINKNAKLHELRRVSGGWNVNTLKLFMSGAYSDLYNIWQGLKGK